MSTWIAFYRSTTLALTLTLKMGVVGACRIESRLKLRRFTADSTDVWAHLVAVCNFIITIQTAPCFAIVNLLYNKINTKINKTNKQTNEQKWTDWETGRQPERQTDKKANKQTELEKNWVGLCSKKNNSMPVTGLGKQQKNANATKRQSAANG